SVDEVGRVTVAAAGPVDRGKGVFYPPNLPFDEVQIVKPLQRFSRDVTVINDANAGVLGEYCYGDADAENLVYLTISSGIGAGVVMDGDLIEGWKGNVGEVGHTQIVENGVECGCGGTGHWEAYCSGEKIPDFVEHVTGREYSDAREVFRDYESGDDDLEEVFERLREYNARGIANIVNLYNPSAVRVGGGVALNHPDVVFGDLEEKVRKESVNAVPDIEPASLREEAVIHGLKAVANGHGPEL
ncbi:MAG: ROK family protein, partial [Candidatus Nanohaloarchaea archaeon]